MPCLAVLAADVDLEVARERDVGVGRTALLGAALDLGGEPQGVERVQHGDVRQHLPDLVALQPADEVPARIEAHARGLLGLRDELLRAVLPEVDLPGGERLLDGVDGMRLGHADDGDPVGVAPGALTRRRDALADGLEPCGDGGCGRSHASRLRPRHGRR